VADQVDRLADALDRGGQPAGVGLLGAGEASRQRGPTEARQVDGDGVVGVAAQRRQQRLPHVMAVGIAVDEERGHVRRP
jgi:hypothetical protein